METARNLIETARNSLNLIESDGNCKEFIELIQI